MFTAVVCTTVIVHGYKSNVYSTNLYRSLLPSAPSQQHIEKVERGRGCTCSASKECSSMTRNTNDNCLSCCSCVQVLGASLEAHVYASDNSALARDCRRDIKEASAKLLKLGRKVPLLFYISFPANHGLHGKTAVCV